jgi:HD-GYP domain-containing protein (c-di-GMP phosphodiesterase class II)
MSSKPLTGYEKADDAEVKALGGQFVCAFVRLVQMARIHEPGNRLVSEAAREFLDTGRRLLEGDSDLTLEAKHDRLFIQGRKLMLQKQNAIFIFSLLNHFKHLQIYGLKLNQQFADTSQEQAYRLACRILEAQTKSDPAAWFRTRLETDDCQWVEVIQPPREDGEESASRDIGETARRIYSFAYNAIKEVNDRILHDQSPGMRKPLRVVQDLTDLIFAEKAIMMGTTTIRDYDDYTFMHSVNVAILSVCLGHEIGLSRSSLVRLGLCGLFHDLGKVDIPLEIVNKPCSLSEGEYEEIKRHSLNSVRRIIKLEASPELIARLILPPFEHHLRYDLTGYPEVGWSRPISFFGRVIHICDVYDALTSSRVYRPVPFSPDQAMDLMFKGKGEDFDPVLLKWFVNMCGVLPVGTVVRFDSGELGLVSSGGDPHENRSTRILLLERRADGFAKGGLIELDARHGSADSRRKISSTHHASEFGIQPALYLLQ